MQMKLMMTSYTQPNNYYTKKNKWFFYVGRMHKAWLFLKLSSLNTSFLKLCCSQRASADDNKLKLSHSGQSPSFHHLGMECLNHDTWAFQRNRLKIIGDVLYWVLKDQLESVKNVFRITFLQCRKQQFLLKYMYATFVTTFN